MNIGIIGLGTMGGGVAKNLLKANFSTAVFDIDKKKMDFFASKGGIPLKDYTEIGDRSDVVMTFLPMSPFDPTLEQAVLGSRGLLNSMKSGSIIMECGNTSPLMEKKFSEEAHKKNILFIDAPVSGGPEGADSGQLSIMVGGDKKAYESCSDIFNAISKHTDYFGLAGTGQLAKLINNMLVATNLAVLSEALAFGTKAGLDPVQLLRAMSGGAADSWVLRTYGEIIINRKSKNSETVGGGFSGVKTGGRDKQLAWALQMADDLETPLPLTSITLQMYQMARGAGKGGLCEPIISMLENMADIFVSKFSKK